MPLVLITGASSGIGKATAKYFQQKGWQVIATMRHPEQEKELQTLSHVEVVQLDVTNQDQINEVIKANIQKHHHIDVVVNNAGYGLFGPLETATAEEISAQYHTNVFGLMHVCQAILPHFRAQKTGTIINISSMGGKISLPFYSLYMSSKWAVEGLSESLQYELYPFNIKIKLIEPGAIETDFFSRSLKTTNLDTYKTLFDLANTNMGQWSGSSPALVAQTIYQAATDQKNKLRYPVGKDAKWLLFFKRILPDSLWMFFVKRMIMK